MTILELSKRFEEAQKSLNNINCALLAGREKVYIEDIQQVLNYLINKIISMTPEQKNLTIVNYTL